MAKGHCDDIPSGIRNFSLELGLKVEKLSPKHAGLMREMFKSGTEHIANYLAWGESASRWNTKDCLFWIQDLLREPEPSEHYAFFRGNQMVGVGVLGTFKTGFGIREDSRHIQMAYWIGREHLGKRFGDRMVRIMERIAFEHKGYSYLHVINDSSNHTTSHMATRLGYILEDFYEGEIRGKKESGLYYSWVKPNPKLKSVLTKKFE